jgi:hypothetical protein
MGNFTVSVDCSLGLGATFQLGLAGWLLLAVWAAYIFMEMSSRSIFAALKSRAAHCQREKKNDVDINCMRRHLDPKPLHTEPIT